MDKKNIFTILEKLVKKYKYLHKPILDDYISTFTRTFLEYIYIYIYWQSKWNII